MRSLVRLLPFAFIAACSGKISASDASASDASTPPSSTPSEGGLPPSPDASTPSGCPAPTRRTIAARTSFDGDIQTFAVDSASVYFVTTGHYYTLNRSPGAVPVQRASADADYFSNALAYAGVCYAIREINGGGSFVRLGSVIGQLDVGLPDLNDFSSEGLAFAPDGTLFVSLSHAAPGRSGLWRTAIGGPAMLVEATGGTASGQFVVDGDRAWLVDSSDSGHLLAFVTSDPASARTLGATVGWAIAQDDHNVYVAEPQSTGVVLVGYDKSSGARSFERANGWFRAGSMHAGGGWLYWIDQPYNDSATTHVGGTHRVRPDGTCAQDLGPGGPPDNARADIFVLRGDGEAVYLVDETGLVEIR
jgi:hypothetical protein